MGKDATLYLRSDLTADEAKVIIEEAKHKIEGREVSIESRDDLQSQALLLISDGQFLFWDRGLSAEKAYLLCFFSNLR